MSARNTRGRSALQEITNAENDHEKPPAKKQRSDPNIEIVPSKPNTRLTRRNSLTGSTDNAGETASSQTSTFTQSPQYATASQSQSQTQRKSRSITAAVAITAGVTAGAPSAEKSNDLSISLDSIATSSVSSAKKSSRKRNKKPDPSQCLEIISMMYDRFYQQEVLYKIDPYIENHHDINQKMRGILVDWLVEVHFKFRLQAPTLWLCVNILDRFLSAQLLQRNRLQLLGVAALLIACKFEEIFPPEVQDCVFITDRAYSKDEVLVMEQQILQTLDYQLCVPTGYHFLTRYLNLIHANEIVKNLSFYYAERNLQEFDSLNFKPSLFAAGALYAALVQQAEHSLTTQNTSDTVNDDAESQSVWPDILIEESDYDERDVLPVARLLIHHVREEPVTTSNRRLVATKKKYLNDKFHHIADFPLPTFPNDASHYPFLVGTNL